MKLSSFLLLPVSICVQFFTLCRRKFYDNGWLKANSSPIPSICVGNIKMGGTGKTPMTEFLIEKLQNNNNIALVSRGYKRKSKKTLILDSNNLIDSDLIGDEPSQIFYKFPFIKLIISTDRMKGISLALNKFPEIDILILDDGFQHLAFKPSLKLLLTEYDSPFFNDYVFPAGKLREGKSAAKYADAIIVTKTPENISEKDKRHIIDNLKIERQQIFFTSIIYKNLIPKNNPATQFVFDDNSAPIILTGIANSSQLINFIAKKYNNFFSVSFSDHHSFKEKDINKLIDQYFKNEIKNRFIVTTEKDFPRLNIPEYMNLLGNIPLFVLPVNVNFLFDEEKKFMDFINRFILPDFLF